MDYIYYDQLYYDTLYTIYNVLLFVHNIIIVIKYDECLCVHITTFDHIAHYIYIL